MLEFRQNARIILFFLAFTSIITSCQKEEFDEQQSALTSTQTQEYLTIWKSILLRNNNMSEEFFKSNIRVTEVSSSKWNSGISFRVNYRMNVDWATIVCYDKFLVQLYSSVSAYQHLGIRRDVFFNEQEISYNVSRNVESEINRYNFQTKFIFRSPADVLKAAIDSSGYNQLVLGIVTYDPAGILKGQSYDPYYTLSGVINRDENRCLSGLVNLVTGKTDVWMTNCYTIN